MAFVPFIDRKEGVVYKCDVCLDYGGLLDPETSDDEGLPLMMACYDCPEEGHDGDRS
jgi:hypothetical protein